MQRREFLKIVAAAVACPSLPTGAAKAATKVAIPNYAALPVGGLYKVLLIRKAESLVILANELEMALFQCGTFRITPTTNILERYKPGCLQGRSAKAIVYDEFDDD